MQVTGLRRWRRWRPGRQPRPAWQLGEPEVAALREADDQLVAHPHDAGTDQLDTIRRQRSERVGAGAVDRGERHGDVGSRRPGAGVALPRCEVGARDRAELDHA